MGDRKIRDIFEWCNHLGLLERNPRSSPQVLTTLGSRLVGSTGWTNRLPLLDILFTNLVTNHKIINKIVNDLAHDAVLYALGFSKQEYRYFLTSLAPTIDAKVEVVLDRSSMFLNALTQPSSFGKLEIFSLTEDHLLIKLKGRIPDWRSAAYIFYKSWPENTSRVKISEIINGQNSLGRIFFMTESQVMLLLSKLEQERAIALEIIADLNQVGLNPAMKVEDFLEMLIHDQS
jgi:hypothetical protein